MEDYEEQRKGWVQCKSELEVTKAQLRSLKDKVQGKKTALRDKTNAMEEENMNVGTTATIPLEKGLQKTFTTKPLIKPLTNGTHIESTMPLLNI
jgi:hypothetical protein